MTRVLIFDSGVGGFSVFQEIEKRLPSIDYFYIFDNKAYPYGELAHDTLLARVNSIVTQMVERHQIDLVVIACNTASTVVLPTLRKNLSIPVVGVVPAIKPASSISSQAVGLIATPATITREYTQELIRNFSKSKPVEMLGSTRLVDIAEDKLRGKTVCLTELSTILTPIKGKVDVAVLGCTHFPLIREEIGEILGSKVQLVDSGEAIARRVESLVNSVVPTKLGKREVFATLRPKEESALNRALSVMNFNPIQSFRRRFRIVSNANF
ncbi:glutamate racemase [Vibrio sonorensis]|uniref:glutamate racemase n=1 Tax=Vibrio sonorensis TaxID=1004316 RepID=UPI0008D9E35F|nr:glutamate racemase [Vibrio sonorensis]